MKRIALFCGAKPGNDARFAEVARSAARAIVEAGYGIVYGGGRVGLMGAIADAALEAGGEVIGVIPAALASEEVAHHGVTQLHVVGSMHERKALIAERSDAFVALPGGIGTMDEFFEMLTWRYLNIHDKPVALLDHGGYYGELLALLDSMVAAGFLDPATRALPIVEPTISGILAALR